MHIDCMKTDIVLSMKIMLIYLVLSYSACNAHTTAAAPTAHFLQAYLIFVMAPKFVLAQRRSNKGLELTPFPNADAEGKDDDACTEHTIRMVQKADILSLCYAIEDMSYNKNKMPLLDEKSPTLGKMSLINVKETASGMMLVPSGYYLLYLSAVTTRSPSADERLPLGWKNPSSGKMPLLGWKTPSRSSAGEMLLLGWKRPFSGNNNSHLSKATKTTPSGMMLVDDWSPLAGMKQLHLKIHPSADYGLYLAGGTLQLAHDLLDSLAVNKGGPLAGKLPLRVKKSLSRMDLAVCVFPSSSTNSV
jgi:hypothetical protein